MTKGTYNIEEDQRRPSKDGSFRSCICTMLVFLAICIILILVTLPLRGNKQPNIKEKDVEIISDENPSNKYEKIIAGDIETTDTEPTKKSTNPDTTRNPIKTTQSWLLTEKYSTIQNKEVTHSVPIATASSTTTDSTITTEFSYRTYETSENKNITEKSTKLHEDTTTESGLNVDIPITSSTESTTIINENNSQVNNFGKIGTTVASIEISTTTEFITTTEYLDNSTTENIDISTTENLDISTIEYSDISTTEYLDNSTTESNESSLSTDYSNIISTEIPSTVTSSADEITTLNDINSNIFETDSTILTTETTSTTTSIVPAVISLSTTVEPTEETYYDITESDGSTLIEEKEIIRKSTTVPSSSSALISGFKQQQPVCYSLGCKSAATRMLNQINHSADPCEDFYDYACGADNLDTNTIDEDNWKRIANKVQEINEKSSENQRIFRKYYESCVQYHGDFDYETRVRGAKDILHSVSKLYDRTQQISKELTLTELLTRLLLVDSSPLFDISVDVDKQSKHFVFQLSLGKPTLLQAENTISKAQLKCFRNLKKKFHKPNLELNSFYEKYLACQKNHSDYLNEVERAVKTFGAFSDLDEYNTTWHIQNLRTTIEWDILAKLEDLPMPSSIQYDLESKRYKVYKVSDLNLQYSFVNWSELLSKLVNKPVNGEHLVQVYFAEYFNQLCKQLHSLPSWQVHNALLAMFAHELYTNLVIPVSTNDVENFCLRQTSRLLSEVSSSMYLSTWSKNDLISAETEMNATVLQLKTHITDAIKETEWLDDTSRVSLLLKLNKMDFVSVNSASVWQNDTFINSRMIVDILNDRNVDYQQYAIVLLRRHRKIVYEMWGEYALLPQNVWWFYATPFNKNPVTIYSLNLIVVPPSKLLHISKDIPRYISLAQLGYSLAKQIGSHFDTVGIRYGMKLSQESYFSYKSMETCGTDKYSLSLSQSINGQIFSFKINGTLSLNERIAEDMAIKLVSDMSVDVINDPLLPWISESFSREKVFYLAIAQEHCEKFSFEDYIVHLLENTHLPPSFLLKSLFANLATFSDTFQCPVGSGMNHPMKCPSFPDLPKEIDYYSYT